MTNGTANINRKEGIDNTGSIGGMLFQGLPKGMKDAGGLYRTWRGTCFEGSDAIEIHLLIRLASRLCTFSDDAVWTEYTRWSGEADLAPWGSRATSLRESRHTACLLSV